MTPLNDSFVDFDVLGMLGQADFTVTGEGHYAEMVRNDRRQRRLVDGQISDWIVVRKRLSAIGSRRSPDNWLSTAVLPISVVLRRASASGRWVSAFFKSV